MNKQESNSPRADLERLPPNERQARIAGLKKDAPSLIKRDRRASVRSMMGAIFAVIGLFAIFYTMKALDSVDRKLAEEQGLQRVDTIEAVPELRIDALIARIEQETAEAEAQSQEEWKALLDVSEAIRVDDFDVPLEADDSIILEVPVKAEIRGPRALTVPKLRVDDLAVPQQ